MCSPADGSVGLRAISPSILLKTTHITFIHFDCCLQKSFARPHHCEPQIMQPRPSGR